MVPYSLNFWNFWNWMSSSPFSSLVTHQILLISGPKYVSNNVCSSIAVIYHFPSSGLPYLLPYFYHYLNNLPAFHFVLLKAILLSTVEGNYLKHKSNHIMYSPIHHSRVLYIIGIGDWEYCVSLWVTFLLSGFLGVFLWWNLYQMSNFVCLLLHKLSFLLIKENIKNIIWNVMGNWNQKSICTFPLLGYNI